MADDAAETQEPDSGGKKRLILMVAVVLVAVAASIAGTLFFLGQDEPATAEAVVEEAPTKAIYYQLRPSFIVNYATDTKPRYLQAEISVMARDAALIEALVDHTPLVRSTILRVLSDASFDRIRTHDGKEQLREKLRAALDQVMSSETELSGLETVLFTNFVLQ